MTPAKNSSALVFIQNGTPVTTSLKIAEVFEKPHKGVLNSIRNMGCSNEFTERNFSLSEYRDPTNHRLPMYLLTRDGATLLIMGYSGPRAMEFKEAYIAGFN